MEKRCTVCNEIKPIERFYKHPNTKDGHFSKCHACHNAKMREHRKEQSSRVREPLLCLRPERLPGVVPACEWGIKPNTPVSLPRLKFLELPANV